MRLQYRLFLALSGMLLLLVGAAVWGLRALTADLGLALDQAGLSVGRAVVAVLDRSVEQRIQGGTPDAAGTAATGHRLIVRRIETGASEDALRATVEETLRARRPDVPMPAAAGSAPAASPAAGDVRVLQREFRLDLDSRGGDLRLYTDGAQHRIEVPRAGVDTALERFSRSVLVGAAVVLLLGTVLAYLLAQRLTRPLRDLAAAARRVGAGELGQRVPVRGGPELRATLATFNQMSGQLLALDSERRRLLELKGLGELGEVGRGIAHSMRNPLNTLGLSVDSLAAGGADPAQAEALRQRARDQIRRIDDALKSFLVLGTQQAGGTQTVDLRMLLDDLLLEASQRAAGRVRFAVTTADVAMPLQVQPHELRSALQALLVNALEASPDGSNLDIELSAIGPAQYQVQIADRGTGLDAQIRSRLFTPHATTKPDGAGMGLFLAQRILKDRYGGSLALEDRAGGGTVARATFGARCDD